MGSNVSRDLLERYFREVWGNGDADAVAQYLDASYVRHIAPALPPIDREQQVARLKNFRAAFPDIEIRLEAVVAEDDLVAFRSTMRGTHEGEFLGLAATGRTVTVGLIDIWRVANGCVVEQWGGPDMFDLLRQLGATFTTGT